MCHNVNMFCGCWVISQHNHIRREEAVIYQEYQAVWHVLCLCIVYDGITNGGVQDYVAMETIKPDRISQELG